MTLNHLIDSHCHIVFSTFQDDLDEVAARWREAGVKSLVHACVNPSEIPEIRKLADRFSELRYSVGVHPLDIKHWKEGETIDILRTAALDDPRVVAIGELGLDLYKDSNLEEQLSALKPQLKLAANWGLQIENHESVLNVLPDFLDAQTLPLRL